MVKLCSSWRRQKAPHWTKTHKSAEESSWSLTAGDWEEFLFLTLLMINLIKSTHVEHWSVTMIRLLLQRLNANRLKTERPVYCYCITLPVCVCVCVCVRECVRERGREREREREVSPPSCCSLFEEKQWGFLVVCTHPELTCLCCSVEVSKISGSFFDLVSNEAVTLCQSIWTGLL